MAFLRASDLTFFGVWQQKLLLYTDGPAASNHAKASADVVEPLDQFGLNQAKMNSLSFAEPALKPKFRCLFSQMEKAEDE
jgi:hypothetical protein